MKYKNRTNGSIIEAIQYTDNSEETRIAILSFTKNMIPLQLNPYIGVSDVHGSILYIYLTDYIIKYSDTKYEVMSKETFEKHYKEDTHEV